MILLNSLTKYKESRVYRVIVSITGGYSTGSGFFVGENKFLTCFHVAFTKELRQLRFDQRFISIAGNDEHSKLREFYNQIVTGVAVELPDGTRAPATLKNFNESYDIALFEVELAGKKINLCRLDYKPKLNRGDYLYFGGFPIHHDYSFDRTPLAIHEGIISSFVETQIGGEKYEHIQINSINLGGNSGAPLFKRWGRKVIGIVNGNLTWKNGMVPLSIAYATPLDILKERTGILN